MSTGRFVAEIPIRWSASDERIALARLRTAQGLANEVLAEYLRRAAAYQRDPDLRRLWAESREAKREGRASGPARRACGRSVPEAVVPRVFCFISQTERAVAWRTLQERHGLIGEVPSCKLTPVGRERYEETKAFVKALTGRQASLGRAGLDAATIHHEIAARQRDRVLAWLGMTKREGGPTGRPRFSSRRFPVTSCTGSSSAKNGGALRLDVAGRTFTWKAARGKHAITARLRLPKDDPWLRKALCLPVTQMRVLHRTIGHTRRWFVQVVLVGTPPLAPRHRAAIASRSAEVVGVDVGSRHIAAVGADVALLADLAPTMLHRELKRDAGVSDVRDGDRRKRDRWYRRLQRRISLAKARHAANVAAVRTHQKVLRRTADGKAIGKAVPVPAGFKKGAKVVVSKRVSRMVRNLADIARADANARSRDHGRLANVVLTMGDRVALEGVGYVGWQRSFGRQVRRFAPGQFEARIRGRASLFDVDVATIPTSTRLSQLCHACGAFVAEPIRGAIVARTKSACACGRAEVHRDLYSAFVARFVRDESSVDLHAASVTWAGAFRLLSGARQAYDTAESGRFVRPFRASDNSSLHSAVVPQAQVAGSPAALADATHATPASVRDARGSESGPNDSSGRSTAIAVQPRSKPLGRARLRPKRPEKRVLGVRVGLPLETCVSDAGQPTFAVDAGTTTAVDQWQ